MKLLRAIRGYVCIVLIACFLFSANLCQLGSLIFLPFSRRWFTLYNMGCQYIFCNIAIAGGKFCGNKMIVTGDVPRRENALVFSNHQSAIDILLIWTWSMQCGAVAWIKWFAKDVLKYVPGVGWGLLFTNAVFLKRNWAKDASSIGATFAKLREGRLPTWLVIFPEGTRINPAKLATSRAFAESKGLPVLNNVLLPRGKGIHASLQGLGSGLSCVYDVTIQFEGRIPSAIEFFTVGNFTVYMHTVRYELRDMPTRERGLNAWLLNVFQEKDKRMTARRLGAKS
jgi:1-acyl-sn-glycerol-3-phosphate acyltransferase